MTQRRFGDPLPLGGDEFDWVGTSLGGLIWAIAQPDRITLLHPHHQGFWWLFVEPPLLVMVVGLIFARLVARPLIADLESLHEAS